LKAEIEDPEGNSVGAELFNSYLTTTETNLAISQATTALKAEIEDPEGNSVIAVLSTDYYTKTETDSAISAVQTTLNSAIQNNASTLVNDYYTAANTNTAISNAVTQLKSSIEDPEGSSVGAMLANSYRTAAESDAAISNAISLLQSQIEDPNGNSIGATLLNEYLTSTDTTNAITQASNQLKSQIENPFGNSIAADLYNNYFTKTDVNSAISSATTTLKSQIEDPNGNSIGAILNSNFYTKSETDSAISSVENTLNSAINGVNSTLINDYYTESAADSAISSAVTQLKSQIENPNGNSLGANLYQNYFTKTQTNSAISTANTVLKSEIEDKEGNSLGASLETLSQTVASNQDEFSALWGVKTYVNGVSGGFGLVNDGQNVIFSVEADRFAIVQDSTGNGVHGLKPVFAVVDGQTVISEAVIDDAYIQTLVTDSLLADRVLIGSELKTPSINYNKSNGVRTGNFSMSPDGTIKAISCILERVTIRDQSGNTVFSSDTNGGVLIDASKVDGLGALATQNSVSYKDLSNKPTLGPFAGLSKILSSNVSTYIANGAIGSAQINQAYINSLFGNNASFYGTVYAANIEGDVTDLRVKTSPNVNATTHSQEYTVISFTISSLPFARSVTVSGIKIIGSHGFSAAPEAEVLLYVSGFSGAQDSYTHAFSGSDGTRTAVTKTLAATIPANSSRTVTLKIKKTSTEGTQTVNAPAQSIICQTFKDGSTIS
ncbi:phage tail tip fiber protein, partial [Pseudoalteromonas lipolytica]|uniref:phage tail tip fiber protein n=3 Tax=Pseudoalteromonas TaxID=53246 RepID=UPI00241EF5F6